MAKYRENLLLLLYWAKKVDNIHFHNAEVLKESPYKEFHAALKLVIDNSPEGKELIRMKLHGESPRGQRGNQ